MDDFVMDMGQFGNWINDAMTNAGGLDARRSTGKQIWIRLEDGSIRSIQNVTWNYEEDCFYVSEGEARRR